MASDEVLASIYRQFDKDELLDIAGELGVVINERSPVARIIKALAADLEEEGVPEAEVSSDLMNEFLYVAGYIDEDGELIEVNEDEPESPDQEEDETSDNTDSESVPNERPACFSLADDRDPACNRCAVFQACLETRINRRPECFGVAYSEHAEECKICIERPFCRLETQKITQV